VLRRCRHPGKRKEKENRNLVKIKVDYVVANYSVCQDEVALIKRPVVKISKTTASGKAIYKTFCDYSIRVL